VSRRGAALDQIEFAVPEPRLLKAAQPHPFGGGDLASRALHPALEPPPFEAPDPGGAGAPDFRRRHDALPVVRAPALARRDGAAVPKRDHQEQGVLVASALSGRKHAHAAARKRKRGQALLPRIHGGVHKDVTGGD